MGLHSWLWRIASCWRQHEQVRHTRDNAPPDASARRGACIAGVVRAPPHDAITRYLAGRVEPQRIGDLPLPRLLGHHEALSFHR
jgi:hypothetical protein